MRLTRIEVENFLGYEHLDLDLAAIDSLVVVGPNGAGKSTLLDAVTWALFNKARTNLPDKLIHDGAELAHVRVEFTTGGHEVVVIRQKPRGKTGTLALEVDGAVKTQHTTAETFEAIAGWIGMPYAALLAGPFMVQKESDSFMAADPRRRKDMLIELLDLSVFADLHEAAKRCRDEFAGMLRAAETAVERLAADVEAGPPDMAAAEAAVAAANQQVSAAEHEVATLKARRAEAAADVARAAELGANIWTLDEEMAGLHATLGSKIDRLRVVSAGEPEPAVVEFEEVEFERLRDRRDAAQRARERYIQLSSREEALLGDIERAKTDIAVLDTVPCQHLATTTIEDAGLAGKVAETCLSCEFLVRAKRTTEVLPGLEEDAARALSEVMTVKPEADSLPAIAQELAALDQRKRDAHDAALRHQAWATREASRDSVIDALEEAILEAGASLDRRIAERERLALAYADVRTRLDGAVSDGAVEEAADRLRAVVEMRDRRVETLADARSRDAMYRVAVEGLARETAAVEYGKARVAGYETLMRAFHRNGIPTSVIESMVGSIEAEANEMLDRLPGDLQIALRTQHETKAGTTAERLDIVVSTGGWERDYGLLSVGQRFRVDLALRIGLSRVLSHHRSTEVQTLWLDEPLADLDATSREAVVETLAAVGEDFPLMVVVSHHPEFNDAFANVLTVNMEGGVSEAVLT